ncbi:hypothetical protein AcV5_000330 [Taiwanofungus camphoratus]|nr:hypothetical protein AcV5_000330 [Antrodia cinnamomea]
MAMRHASDIGHNVLQRDTPGTSTPLKSKLLRLLDAHLTVTSPSYIGHTASGSKTTAGHDRQSVSPPSKSMIKGESERVDTTLSRKRSLKVEDHKSAEMNVHSLKKPKSEALKTPLTPVNHNSGLAQQRGTVAMPDFDTADTRAKLADVQTRITRLQVVLAKVRRKAQKTRADITRIVKYERELKELRASKHKLNAAIPSAVHAHSADAAKMEMKHLVADYASMQPIASGSNVRLPPARIQSAYSAALNALHTPVVVPQNDIVTPGIARAIANIGRMDYVDDEKDMDERFDEDGNFYGRGRDTFAGPVAKADDIDKFLLAAGNAEQFDGNARVDKALEKLGLDGLYRPLPGMEVALMPHQTIGVAWMLEKEKNHYRGGCMSDEMGLGKTVQMIAVIVANRSKDPLCKTNLIIAPLALLDQWQLEIEMKTNCNLKCYIYHGSNKVKKKQDLLKYDVVLTTFHTLAMEWPDEEAEEKKAKKKKRKDDFILDDSEEEKKHKKKSKRERGLLMLTEWYRVILDEAQNIRNKRTRISRAVTELHAEYRWCLTGTPIINGLSDAYGLLRFLRIRPWYDWDEFNSHVSRLERKQPGLATTRLQAIFASMLLRRKKDSMLDGKRLIELSPKKVILVKLEFSLEERDIYKMVELRSQAIFNRFLRAGTVLKNYHQVLVLLLRLRQFCSHPSLIQEEGVAFIDPADLDDKHYDRRYELSRAKQLVSAEFVENMKQRLKHTALQRMEAEKQSADASVEDEECPICYDVFSDPVVTPCAHVFCRDCIINVINTPLVENSDENAKYRDEERPCPTCRGIVSKHKIFSRRAFEPSDEEIGIAGGVAEQLIDVKLKPVPGRTLRKRKPAKRTLDSDVEGDDDFDDDLSDFIVESGEDEEEKDARRALKKRLGKRRAIVLSDNEMDFDDDVICGANPDVYIPPEQIKLMPKFLPSTKMKRMMELVRTWAEEHPDEKTLIISQWTQCLQLVSDYLTENGFLHVKYQGDMNRSKRDQAVRVFMAKDKATIMLMSLKCGGVGLNLTRANRVISLDLGWSEAVESQAFDRVHRLGQTRPVYVHRLVISDTVEDRVLALQERKKNLADGSLGEGAGKKIGRLSVRELANLFGLDHRGHLLSDD